MTALTQHELMFQARMNIRYHEALERRYQSWINWTSFASVTMASAAFAAMADVLPADLAPYKNGLAAGVTLLVTLLNGGVLAFGMLDKLGVHADLKRQWMSYLGRVNAARESMADLEREFHALNAREPAPKPRLLGQAYHDTCAALGLQPEERAAHRGGGTA